MAFATTVTAAPISTTTAAGATTTSSSSAASGKGGVIAKRSDCRNRDNRNGKRSSVAPRNVRNMVAFQFV
jgi:hypothetical protein